MRTAGAVLLGMILLAACAAPWLAPNPPNARFSDLLYAPPTWVHVGDGMAAPHVHPLRIVSRLERRFEEDRTTHVPLRWFSGGVLVSADSDKGAPLLLLGADGFGRDRFSRLLHGSRATLALALLATLFATVIGALVGGVAGYAGGRLDTLLSRFSEFVVVRGDAARAPGLHSLRAAAGNLRVAWLADGGARRACDRPRRARSRVRCGGACCGRQPYALAHQTLAACGRRISEHAGHLTAAGVHPR
jgi:hypothetical protein